MEEALVRVVDLCKVYNPGENEVRALDHVNLEIHKGEFVAIIGQSGSGKSTFMNMLGCLDVPTSGKYYLNGTDVSTMKDNDLSVVRNKEIGFIFQGFNLIANLTAIENVELPLIYRGIDRKTRRKLAVESLKKVGLEKRMDHKPNEMSGGQQQRVAIGRALVRKPKLFLLDEPFSNLDPSLRAQLRREVKRLHEKIGTTFIYVTHDQAEAFMLGTRIVAMRHGMIEQAGTPKALYNHPLNTYVASFVGVPPMNLLDAQLTRREKSWYVRVLRTEYPISEKQCAALADSDEGREIRLGIRPVHLLFGDKGIEAEVEYAETTGKEFVVHLQVGDTSVTLVLPGDTPPSKIAKHAKGRLEMQPEYFHLFDKESGKRI